MELKQQGKKGTDYSCISRLVLSSPQMAFFSTQLLYAVFLEWSYNVNENEVTILNIRKLRSETKHQT